MKGTLDLAAGSFESVEVRDYHRTGDKVRTSTATILHAQQKPAAPPSFFDDFQHSSPAGLGRGFILLRWGG